MKRLILSFLFFLLFFKLASSRIQAWLDCPYGKINDPFPGSCQLYVDTNNNQICDHSEPAAERRVPEETVVQEEEKQDGLENTLPFYLIFLTPAFYFLHWYLVNKTKLSKKFKCLNKTSFRYFWNLVLLLAFLPTAVSGLLFILKVRNPLILSLHNQVGTIFVVVGLLHFFTRFQYFLKRP